MPGLAQSLQGKDLGHLLIVAELWGIELHVKDIQDAVDQLESALPGKVAEGWEQLPAESQQALSMLSSHEGKMPWGAFIREVGELREMGPGRRDREQPYRHPISTAEFLWYRGLIARAFFDTPDGPQEFAYIPDDLLTIIPSSKPKAQPFGRPARPEERAAIMPANDGVLDQACTLLAGMRMGLPAQELTAANARADIATLKALLSAAGLLDANGKLVPEATKRFLEAERSAALLLLARSWQESIDFNELRLLPGLKAEGHWSNEPKETRRKILGFARSAPAGQWWNIPALVADVKARQPDFQRPAGDYDSWYLRDVASGEYLRGFQHWDAIDGAVIAYMIRGPLHWLGFMDLAGLGEGAAATAFRWSEWAEALLKGKRPRGLRREDQKVKLDSRGKVLIPVLAPRAVRYLVARFCEWLPQQKDNYVYQITAQSLARARKQGLKVGQLLALLKANSAAPLPPNMVQALKRWEQQGAQARLGKTLVLRLGSAGALKALRASRAGRYLGEPLGPAAVVVKPGAGQQVLQALLELGYLGELEEDGE